jgi:hypothetical protein
MRKKNTKNAQHSEIAPDSRDLDYRSWLKTIFHNEVQADELFKLLVYVSMGGTDPIREAHIADILRFVWSHSETGDKALTAVIDSLTRQFTSAEEVA